MTYCRILVGIVRGKVGNSVIPGDSIAMKGWRLIVIWKYKLSSLDTDLPSLYFYVKPCKPFRSDKDNSVNIDTDRPSTACQLIEQLYTYMATSE